MSGADGTRGSDGSPGVEPEHDPANQPEGSPHGPADHPEGSPDDRPPPSGAPRSYGASPDDPPPPSGVPRSYGASPDEPAPQPALVPYGTAQGLPPPATYPFGTQAGPDAAAPASAAGPGDPTVASRPRAHGSEQPPAGQPPIWGQPSRSHPPGGVPPPVDPIDVARAVRFGRLAVFNAVVGLFFSFVFFPIGIIFDVVAIVLGIKARRAAVLAGRGEGAGVFAVVVGSIGVALATVLATVLAVFWTEMQTYWDCTSGANTNTAQSQCNEVLEEDILRRLGL